MTDYAARKPTENSDGTPLFANDIDTNNERAVASQIERAWNCELRAFGKLCPIDYYALRDERIVGAIEIKARSHESTKFPTVYLNFRKWLALQLAEIGFGVPSIYVVKFTDRVMHIANAHIPVGIDAIGMGGTSATVKSHTDYEPVLHVPVALMRPTLGDSK